MQEREEWEKWRWSRRRRREKRRRRSRKRNEEKVEEEEKVGEGEGEQEEGKHYGGLESEWPPVSSLRRSAPKCVSQTKGRSQPGLCCRISRRAENWSERRRAEARRTHAAL